VGATPSFRIARHASRASQPSRSPPRAAHRPPALHLTETGCIECDVPHNDIFGSTISISDDGGAGQTLEVPSPTTGLENIRYVVPCPNGDYSRFSNADPFDLAGPDVGLPMMAVEKGLLSRTAHRAEQRTVRSIMRELGIPESHLERFHDELHDLVTQEGPKTYNEIKKYFKELWGKN